MSVARKHGIDMEKISLNERRPQSPDRGKWGRWAGQRSDKNDTLDPERSDCSDRGKDKQNWWMRAGLEAV